MAVRLAAATLPLGGPNEPFAARRLCAPSFVLMMASLALGFLATPHAQAGTYIWQTKDANGKITAQSPSFSGGTATGLFYSPQGKPIYSASYPPATGSTYSGGGGRIPNPTATGAISATLTWQADPTKPTDPAPPAGSVVVTETCTAKASAIVQANATCSAQCDDGMGQSGSTQSVSGTPSYYNTATPPQVTQYTASVSTTDTRYSVGGGSTISLTLSPSASATASGPNYGGGLETAATVSYTVSVSPVTISLPGTKTDGNGNLRILVGQKCTGMLNGIPSALTPTTANHPVYEWSVDGNTFQSWNVASDQSTATATYGIGDSTQASPSWCWSDKAQVQYVFCKVTLTPPAGQGSSFVVNAEQPVTLDAPNPGGDEGTGTVQVNALYPAIDNNNPGVYSLWAGPGPNKIPNSGIEFDDTENMALTTLYGSTGTWYHLQLVTPNKFRAPAGGSLTAGSHNGQQGLDGGFPYGGTFPADGNQANSPDIDSPGFALGDVAPNAYQEYSVQKETFTMYIMYTPPGNNSVPVPVSSYTWYWNVDITIPSAPTPKSWSNWGSAPTNGTIVAQSAQSTFQFPTWSQKASQSW